MEEYMELRINNKFKDLIPPLDFEEYENLRESLKNEGCRDSIIVWNGVIVDGHNRYELCKELRIPFNAFEKSFESEDDVLLWIMKNQLSRRNLCDVERGRLALKMKDIIATRARENKVISGGDRKSEGTKSLVSNLTEAILPIRTRKELAKIAGISEGSLSKIEKVDNEAPAPIRAAMGRTISIDKAAQFNALLRQTPKDEREFEAERLIQKAFAEKEERILREEKISKALCNIISAATLSYEFITEESVEIYLKKSPSSIPQITADIDYEIGLLLKLKELFLKIDEKEGGHDEE
jgi:transcriptional regulator with XRE-family HTH domain